MGKLFTCWLTALLAAAPLTAAEVDYLRDVKAVLRERCFACHGALKHEAGLRVDTVVALRKGGDSGAAIEPGDAAASLLVERIAAADESYRMPPEGHPLSAEQIAAFRAWIDQGAIAPADDHPEQDPDDHWAFHPPQRPPIPAQAPSSSTIPNSVDLFLAAEHAPRNLQPVPLADRRLLLRRVYLDLIGLPPTRDEMQTFLADERPDAYERVVERLLESPHYGERWGRHWLDVWRYSDWYGLGDQLRNSQKHIWHWRDWVIESLNADRGYDHMVQAMLAADELTPTDRDALRATGFLARNYFLFNRTTWLDDTIEHTSKAFLGLTLNCAKCHDHKYDPITQEDYYRWRAIFEPHQVRLDPLPGQTDLAKDGLPRVFDAHPDAPTYLPVRGDEKQPDKDRVIPPGPPAFLTGEAFSIEPVALPQEAHWPALQAFVLEDHLAAAAREIEDAREALAKSQAALLAAEKQAATTAEVVMADGEEGAVFLKDDFARRNEETWEIGPGEWKYEQGRLTQTKTGAERASLRSHQNHPADFEATLRFKTLGGQMWKSVGLCFDAANGRETMVYLSAVTPGSKLQISYNAGGGQVYPVEGKQDRPVALNEPQELTVRVRGPLVNVSLGGKHALAYRLPVERVSGRLELVAFDAVAEFTLLEVRPLPANATLVEAGQGGAAPLTVDGARLAVAVAEKALATAEARPEALRTAHAADRAKLQSTPPENLAALVNAAARAARQLEVARAAEAFARAEQKVAQADGGAKPQAEKTLQGAREALEKAKQAVESPGETYASIQASLKALEGPDETDASRRQPYPATSTGRRAALARWITARDNPLTARVAVNHLWMRHFGQPLIDPVTDFGRRAAAPPQQKLLDWLAVEFMENGWSMKHMHRLMVTSQAYRLSSSTRDADQATVQADPENHYYWRRRPLRMESEVIRDSLLRLAGALNPALGGPTINPKQDDTVFRRSMYFTRSRDDQHAFLSMFDDADILGCYRRSESIVPQQALTLSNSKLSLAMARRLASKLQTDLGDVDDAAFVLAAYETIVCVTPTAEEQAVCQSALDELKSLLEQRRHPQPSQRAREDLIHALLNHNDFVTIR